MSTPATAPLDLREYYRHPGVRARMLQYSGAVEEHPATAVFVAGLRAGSSPIPTWDHDAERLPMSAIAPLWDGGYDIARSLWDRRHLVFLVEIDYQNADAVGEPFLHPADVFLKLEPSYRAARRVLSAMGIQPQAIMTGRGYQFTGAIPLTDPVIDRLADLSPGEPVWHTGVPGRLPTGVSAEMSVTQARASVGLGLLIEHVAHLVKKQADRTSAIPVVFNGTLVGTGLVGREAVSLDFSHAGDPLDIRHFRAAFSTYQFHRMRPDIVGASISGAISPLVALPRGHRSLMAVLSDGRGLAAGVRASRTMSASLPDVAQGVERLRRHYEQSPLAAFHRTFYRMPVAPIARTTDVRLVGAPGCVTACLERPNDLLLNPGHIQHLVRGLMARRWDPRDIATLVRAKYQEDHGWGDRWSRMDPRTRADFDVRVFAGMVATGLDPLVDFNCVSAQEKDLCPRTTCRFDLRLDRERLEAFVARRPDPGCGESSTDASSAGETSPARHG